jgi:hypothetical protein
MPMGTEMSDASLLAEGARIPDHVVYRAFVRETVVLNLQTGKYHGLNPTAGRMFELLDREATLQDAASRLADEYAVPAVQIEGDLCDLVRDLSERGLIELNSHGQA